MSPSLSSCVKKIDLCGRVKKPLIYRSPFCLKYICYVSFLVWHGLPFYFPWNHFVKMTNRCQFLHAAIFWYIVKFVYNVYWFLYKLSKHKKKLARSCSHTYLDWLLIRKRRPTIEFVQDIVGSGFAGPHASIQLLGTYHQPLTSRNTCSYYLCLTFSKANQTKTSSSFSSQKYEKRKVINLSYCSLIVVCYFSTLPLSPASAQQWHILKLWAGDWHFQQMWYIGWLFLFVGGWICNYHRLLNVDLLLRPVCASTKTTEVGPVVSDPNVCFGLFLFPLHGSSPFHRPSTAHEMSANIPFPHPFLNVVSPSSARWKYVPCLRLVALQELLLLLPSYRV
jgi:hypothetical protein